MLLVKQREIKSVVSKCFPNKVSVNISQCDIFKCLLMSLNYSNIIETALGFTLIV